MRWTRAKPSAKESEPATARAVYQPIEFPKTQTGRISWADRSASSMDTT